MMSSSLSITSSQRTTTSEGGMDCAMSSSELPAVCDNHVENLADVDAEASESEEGDSFHEENGFRVIIRDGNFVKPKRALTAYNLFFQEQRRKMLEDRKAEEAKASKTGNTPRIGFAAMARTVSARWKKVDASERETYLALAADDKTRYVGEMKLWKKLEKQVSKEQKKKQKRAQQQCKQERSSTKAQEEAQSQDEPKTEAVVTPPLSTPVVVSPPVVSMPQAPSPSAVPSLEAQAIQELARSLQDSLRSTKPEDTLVQEEQGASQSLANAMFQQQLLQQQQTSGLLNGTWRGNTLEGALGVSDAAKVMVQAATLAPPTLPPFLVGQQQSNTNHVPLADILQQVQEITGVMDHSEGSDGGGDLDAFVQEQQQQQANISVTPISPFAQVIHSDALPAAEATATTLLDDSDSQEELCALAQDLGDECTNMFIDIFRRQ